MESKGKVKEMQIEFELYFSDSCVYKAISPTEPSQHPQSLYLKYNNLIFRW